MSLRWQEGSKKRGFLPCPYKKSYAHKHNGYHSELSSPQTIQTSFHHIPISSLENSNTKFKMQWSKTCTTYYLLAMQKLYKKKCKNVTKLENKFKKFKSFIASGHRLIDPFRIGNYIYSSASLFCNNNY